MRFKKLSVGILATFALASLGGIALIHWRTFVESWYLFRLESPDAQVQEAAREGLVRLASLRAVPRFLTLSQKGLSPYQQHAKRIIEQLEPTQMRELAALLRGEEDRFYLEVVALHKEARGPAAARAHFLKVTLKHPNPWVRRFAAEELSGLGSNARVAARELEEAKRDACEEVRFWASLALEMTESNLTSTQ